MNTAGFDEQDTTGQIPGAEQETGAVGSDRLGGTGVGSGPDDVGVGGAVAGGGGREIGVLDDQDDAMPDYDSNRLGGTGIGSAPGDVGVGGTIGGGGYGDAQGGLRDRMEDRT